MFLISSTKHEIQTWFCMQLRGRKLFYNCNHGSSRALFQSVRGSTVAKLKPVAESLADLILKFWLSELYVNATDDFHKKVSVSPVLMLSNVSAWLEKCKMASSDSDVSIGSFVGFFEWTAYQRVEIHCQMDPDVLHYCSWSMHWKPVIFAMRSMEKEIWNLWAVGWLINEI